MKKVFKILFRAYDVIAHILGHIVLFCAIVGGLMFSAYISYKKDEFYIVLLELIIMLVIVVLILCLMLKVMKGRGDK